MVEYLQSALQLPFVWGLLLGLLIAGFLWKAGLTARRHAAIEIKRVQADMRELQGHLNTQLKINATGNEALNTELESLRRQNENLRVNLAALRQKPGRAEQRLLHIHDSAIRTLREQAPGFAAAWEKAVRQAEADLESADSGLKKLVRRIIPGLGNSSATPGQPGLVVTEERD
ncbi:MAG: hypothetical protein NTW21_23765 [Verrucomicrobia bacterium]|nr:hypothetical protein [Verrucomicrobiota bacterium]